MVIRLVVWALRNDEIAIVSVGDFESVQHNFERYQLREKIKVRHYCNGLTPSGLRAAQSGIRLRCAVFVNESLPFHRCCAHNHRP